MGLGVALITFSPNTLIKSADINSNLAALNGASSFTGQFTGGGTFTGRLQADNNQIVSDGGGNITSVGTIQFSSGNEKLFTHTGVPILDASGNTDLILNAPNLNGGHKFKIQVGGVTVWSVDSLGNVLYKLSNNQNSNP